VLYDELRHTQRGPSGSATVVPGAAGALHVVLDEAVDTVGTASMPT
jgi:hypothetical protein